MPRKTKENDFDITRPSMGGGEFHFSGVWEVFEEYEIRKASKDGDPYITAKGEVKRTYRPLADTPYLFLDLARLGDGTRNREALDSWLEKYGVLGIHYDDGLPYLPVYYPEPALPPLMYDTEGGPQETVLYFWLSVQEANNTLALYEAAVNRDEEKLEQLLNQDGKAYVRSFMDGILRNISSLSSDFKFPEYVDLLVDRALMRVWHVVQSNLSNYAYPTINHELPQAEAVPGFHQGALFTPHHLGASWGFRNLLGAAYLQLYWLITSRADIKRCKYCGRIIPLTPLVEQGGDKRRKRRSDVEYCNKSCQQNYDYHKRRKHKRNSQHS